MSDAFAKPSERQREVLAEAASRNAEGVDACTKICKPRAVEVADSTAQTLNVVCGTIQLIEERQQLHARPAEQRNRRSRTLGRVFNRRQLLPDEFNLLLLREGTKLLDRHAQLAQGIGSLLAVLATARKRVLKPGE